MHRGTDFVARLLNSIVDLAKFRKSSLPTFFGDIITAFDWVIHSYLRDIPLSDEAIWYLMHRLNLPFEGFQELCQTVANTPAVVESQVPAHLRNVSMDILDNNSFHINKDPPPSTINRSTKHGDPLAGLVFQVFHGAHPLVCPFRLFVCRFWYCNP